MKGLFTAVVLLMVLGIVGFLYRYTMEHPKPFPSAACTAEAKICPDGTSMARTGSDCTFAACPLPNKELPDAGIAFVIPAGYTENASAVTPGDNVLIALEKPATGTSTMDAMTHAIVIRRFAIPGGKTAEDVMTGNTQFEMGNNAGIQSFKQVTIGQRTFYEITVEQSSAQFHTYYYLPRQNDVLRFEIIDRGTEKVVDAPGPLDALPEHQALVRMLRTLQVK